MLSPLVVKNTMGPFLRSSIYDFGVVARSVSWGGTRSSVGDDGAGLPGGERSPAWTIRSPPRLSARNATGLPCRSVIVAWSQGFIGGSLATTAPLPSIRSKILSRIMFSSDGARKSATALDHATMIAFLRARKRAARGLAESDRYPRGCHFSQPLSGIQPDHLATRNACVVRMSSVSAGSAVP